MNSDTDFSVLCLTSVPSVELRGGRVDDDCAPFNCAPFSNKSVNISIGPPTSGGDDVAIFPSGQVAGFECNAWQRGNIRWQDVTLSNGRIEHNQQIKANRLNTELRVEYVFALEK